MHQRDVETCRMLGRMGEGMLRVALDGMVHLVTIAVDLQVGATSALPGHPTGNGISNAVDSAHGRFTGGLEDGNGGGQHLKITVDSGQPASGGCSILFI